MKKQILKLKGEGKTNAQIRKILGCSNVIIFYHTDPKYKARHLEMQRNKRRAASAEKKANPQPRKQRVCKPKPEKEIKAKPVLGVRAAKPEQRKYATIPVDNSQKVAVRLDHKTTVFALPGYDLEALKRKYLKIKIA